MKNLPLFHYGAIYVDLPWNFEPYSDKGAGKNPNRHYDCMSIDEMKSLPVGHLASKDCALFMWVTDPMLKYALDVMETWGFEYKTVAFTWAKLAKVDHSKFFMGTGYWTRANPEMCLLGINGAPKRKSCGVRQLVVEPLREHSRKPDRIIGDIEKLVDGPYLELFGRTQRPGWTVWGNETEKFGTDDKS